MDKDMTIMFNAVDKNYKLERQYKYTWNTLQIFGQFRDKRIWKNFTYFIDWMERNFEKEKFFEVMGKSYDLEDNVLCFSQNEWLMSNIYRHVENPRVHEFPERKYIGKIKFTKIHKKAEYADGEHVQWMPPKKNTDGDDIDERKRVADIQIVVYKDDEMKVPRRYELEHGWKDEWIDQGVCYMQQAPDQSPQTDAIYESYKEFEKFKKKWANLKKIIKVPSWYLFDPENPKEFGNDHNMMKKAWDESTFNFLKEQKWMERKSELDAKGRNQYEETSEFVVNCSRLLGIGGEGIIIRKSVSEKIGKIPENHKDREYEALKIITISKHNIENENKANEWQDRVDARQNEADPGNFFPSNRADRHADPEQLMDIDESANEREEKFVETFLKAAENVEMTDEDEETEIKHESLMEFSNYQLDFVKFFGQKIFIMLIG